MLVLQTTGLSGAGKTTICNLVKQNLTDIGLDCIVIDGDIYRQTLCRDLGFSHADRIENIRRLGHLAHTYAVNGTIALIAAINPFELVRNELSERYNAKTVWIDCSIEMLIKRDTKDLYRRALLPDTHADKISNLTGINDVYENPVKIDLYIQTHLTSFQDAAMQFTSFILTETGHAVAYQGIHKA